MLLSTLGLDTGPRTRYMGAFLIRESGEIFLISPSTARKMQEIEKDPHVQVIFSDQECHKVLTLTGKAEVVRDNELRRAIYEEKKGLKIYPVFNDYFGVIRFIPLHAEYLDIDVSNDPVVIPLTGNQQ